MKKKIALFTLLFALLVGIVGNVQAATYLFSVDQETVDAYYEQDGTLTLDYVYVFTNDPGASPIDYVDIGIPNNNYSLSNVSADVNGIGVTDIQSSEYVDNGVALGLGSNSIAPGATGQVHARITGIKQVLYPDDQDNKYASAAFSPNWFGREYVKGMTSISVTLHLPPGVTTQEPRYHIPTDWPGGNEPQAFLDNQGRVAYTWQADANSFTQYTFGASFPAQYVPENTIVRPNVFDKIFEFIGGVLENMMPFLCCGGFGFIFIGLPIWGAISSKKRKLQYMSPKVSIEGHGIKRGLTAVEAALLMEQPLDKVLTMILFSVVKKGAASVKTKEPLDLEVVQPLPADLQPYETDFLQAFAGPSKTRKAAVQDMVIKAIKTVTEKMKGFSRKETLDYYQDIMRRAWAQVETSQTPEVKSQAFEQNLEWTMLDKDFDGHTRQTLSSGPIFIPTWWGRYDPVFAGSSGGNVSSSMSSGAPSSSGRSSVPSLPGSDFAASITNGIQGMAAGVVGNVNTFTSAVTDKTNPVPVSSSSRGGGGHSGGGCACACACAGCACACAGGGR